MADEWKTVVNRGRKLFFLSEMFVILQWYSYFMTGALFTDCIELIFDPDSSFQFGLYLPAARPVILNSICSESRVSHKQRECSASPSWAVPRCAALPQNTVIMRHLLQTECHSRPSAKVTLPRTSSPCIKMTPRPSSTWHFQIHTFLTPSVMYKYHSWGGGGGGASGCHPASQQTRE